MKILLIEPPFYRLYNSDFSLNKYPLSLGYLAAMVKANTPHEVMLYNADFSVKNKPMLHHYLAGEGFSNYRRNIDDEGYEVWDEVKKVIQEFKPKIIGITAKSQNYKSACKVAAIIKKTDPNIITIIGGPHPTLIGKDVMKIKEIDFAAMGEGEVSFLEFLNVFETASDPSQVAGLIWRCGNEIIENRKRPLLMDLNELPGPYSFVKECLRDFKLYPLSSFRSIFATRGCPFNCTFCGSHAVWSRKVRYRSVENVIEEIKVLGSLGVRYFNFDDDTFGVTPKFLQELCTQMKLHCKGMKWSCEIHVNLVNEKNLQLMKDAGCDLIKIGIESGNNLILKEINKHITIEEALDAAILINKMGISTMAFFMVGFPQETEETLNDTIRAIKKIDGYVTYSIFTPYIGTKAYQQCLEMNLIPLDFDVSLYNHTSPNNCFTHNITPERFRELANNIEHFVDKKNADYERKLKWRRYSPNNIFNFLKNSLISKTIQ